jgi:hypothetical protein
MKTTVGQTNGPLQLLGLCLVIVSVTLHTFLSDAMARAQADQFTKGQCESLHDTSKEVVSQAYALNHESKYPESLELAKQV